MKQQYGNYILFIKRLRKYCFFTLLILSMTLICQKTPLLSSFQTSLPQIIISLTLCSYLISNEFPKFIYSLLTMSIWKSWRPVLRASYLFHPLIFEYLAYTLPVKHYNIALLLLHFIIVITLTYLFSSLIVSKIDQPFVKYLSVGKSLICPSSSQNIASNFVNSG